MQKSARIIAYCPLHYGAEYLDACIKSVNDFVEAIHIFYTEKPSYGTATEMICPDNESEMMEIAVKASNKVQWHKITAFMECDHRNNIWSYTDGIDIILPIDADEVWCPVSLENCLKKVKDIEERRIGISGFIHFWKSFNHVCRDGFTPIRILKTKGKDAEKYIDGTIYHFGYAQSLETIKYKWHCHGHQAEIRENWLSKYENWKEGGKDVHPTSIGLWNPERFDKTKLPEILKKHPNYEKNIIYPT